MYALPNKTQHKLVVKVRGGITQKLDNFSLGLNEAGFNAELGGDSHLPQPVFHSVNQNGNKQKSMPHHQRAQKQYITPEHNEMIKYVQQSWKGVERDYKKSVNNFINNIDLNSTSSAAASTTTPPASSSSNNSSAPASGAERKQKKKNASSTPLLLSGSYHHTSHQSGNSRQDSFQPFDLEAFWGNRILKRLTQDM